MNAVIGVRNPVPVVPAALPPIAVLGLPMGGAMLLPCTVLFLLPLTLPLRRTLELGGSLPIGLLAAALLLDALLLRSGIVRRPLLSALLGGALRLLLGTILLRLGTLWSRTLRLLDALFVLVLLRPRPLLGSALLLLRLGALLRVPVLLLFVLLLLLLVLVLLLLGVAKRSGAEKQ